MKILLNNKEFTTDSNLISYLLKELNTDSSTVIVTLNGNVLDKNKFPETILNENDSVELFSFVGGG